MKKNNKFLLVIISVLVLLVSVTTFISFSSNVEVQEVIVKSITPVYDSTSTIEVNNNNIVFNDKNQIVEYNVVIENTQNYNVKITDIQLSTPTEEFLTYEIKNINENDIVEANSTKELIISLETAGIKGWGRNFNDELTANISFEKVRKTEEIIPPVNEDNDEQVETPKEEDNKEEVEIPKEEVKQPEPPAPTIKEVIKQTEKIEPTKVTNDIIEFKEEVKVEVGDKIAVWIYSEPIFLGYFDVVETNGVKQIVGLEEALKKVDVQVGEHNIVLSTEEGETLGYVEVYVSEDNKISEELPEGGKIENPYTSTGWLIVYVTVAGIAVIGIVILRNKKVNKYFILVVALASVLSFVKAEDPIDVSITLSVSFESQNVMKPSGIEYDFDNDDYSISNVVDYWSYVSQIKNFYIRNEIAEIPKYDLRFDVTEEGNGRVMAYLIERSDGSVCTNLEWEDDLCYDLYLQADGIIYPNEDASYYFALMSYLDSIDNLNGLDTSEVISMRGMFQGSGELSETFKLELGDFDTSNVTDMSSMFEYAGWTSSNFTLDVSNFDTRKVTDMSEMFLEAGYESENFTLDVSNFDTSDVTDMSYMFSGIGSYSENFTLDLSNFDTSNVTDMSGMFAYTSFNDENSTLDLCGFDTGNVTDMSYMFDSTGYSSENFSLDISNFDTSNVTNMRSMFYNTGYNSENFTLDISNFDTSNVTDMTYMFSNTGYNSESFILDVSNFDTSKVIDMSYMFWNTGYNSENFTLDLSNFDTSNVTDMSYMFSSTGYNSENFTLDLSNFDTSNVTNMSCMFISTGYNSESFILDVSNFDTSKVIDMSYMFDSTGYSSENFSLDLSNFDTSNVINMSRMFQHMGYNSKNLSIDLSDFDTSNVTDMNNMFWNAGYNSENLFIDVSNFDTSNVINMSWMFENTGYNSENFTLNVSGFDTSKVTNFTGMFSGTGYNSENFNTSITIKNPNVRSYNMMFQNTALKPSSQIKVNYTKETEELVDRMIATKSSDSNVFKGYLIADVDNLDIGNEIHIGDEKFNVISQTEGTVTMLAQYNLSPDYKQSTTSNFVTFSDDYGWEYTPGPKEIDIQTWSTNPKTYINAYVNYLKEELNDDSVTGDLIALKDLEKLGCVVPSDYVWVGLDFRTCKKSPYISWLANGGYWWTKSARADYEGDVWFVTPFGDLDAREFDDVHCVRPVITISKNALRNYFKTS